MRPALLLVPLLWIGCSGAADDSAPRDTDRPDTDSGDELADADGDGAIDSLDCAPDDAAVSPLATELCNGVDDDCDSRVDEGYDGDGDGALVDGPDCAALGVPLDCNDRDAAVFPGAPERCNGIDDDCSGAIDDAADDDGDGYTLCEDCDDAEPTTHPGAEDTCDGVDNDCSGLADEAYDDDGDGVSECGGDCHDDDPFDGPDVPERCDGADNDCDGDVDEGFDQDGDGWTTCRGDCDDTEAATVPGATELCDGLDNDCDPSTSDSGDLDADGYTLCDGDCDDLVAAAHPGGTEVCDGADDDCNGATDELPECFGCSTQGDYLVCTSGVTWPVAEAACEAFGRHLVTIDDDAENLLVGDVAYALTYNASWIGYNDLDVEGTFTWIDGSTSTYTHWNGGEPNDSGGEDCAGTNYGAMYGWNDFPCTSYALPFVCE